MRLLDRVLTPRGERSKPDLPSLALGGEQQQRQPGVLASSEENYNVAETPRGHASRLGKMMSAASRILTPRRRGNAEAADGGASALQAALISPRLYGGGGLRDAQRTAACRMPALAGVVEAQLRLADSPAGSTTPQRGVSLPATSAAATAAKADAATSDTASEADSELSSLDGFGDYARGLGEAAAEEERREHPEGESSCGSASNPDALPSPRQLMAQVQNCSPRQSARGNHRAADDMTCFLQAGELPTSPHRLARLLAHADALGPDAFTDLPLHCLGFERCTALLLQVLLPLPISGRSVALAQLQSKLSAQLLSYLGTSLERVLESERGCQRFCRLPYEVTHWLLEHGPADRGETLFDLANLWLEQQPRQQRKPASEVQQAALAALIWRLPLAADFLRCMEANLPWAADFVAGCGARPARLPASLDGRFSFTAEFELHDLLELQQAALSSGRPQQQQSPAMYCGGYCWWAVLAANPQHDRFELYASCAPFSLFLEPFRAALQPATDVRFTFQGNTQLVDWRQSNEERQTACHTHWGGPAFWVPSGCPSLIARSGSGSMRSPSGMAAGAGSVRTPAGAPMAAAARPDTARGPRPTASRQMSRLSVSSTASAEASAMAAAAGTPPGALASSGSLGSAGPLRSARSSSLGSGQKLPLPPLQRADSGSGYEADCGAVTARHLRPSAAGLQQLSMEQLVAEVRRSCPYTWGASLRVRLTLRLLGGPN